MVRYIVLGGRKVPLSPNAIDKKGIDCRDILCAPSIENCATCPFARLEEISIDQVDIVEDKEDEYIQVLLEETSEHDGNWAWCSKAYKEAKEEGISCRDMCCGSMEGYQECKGCCFNYKSPNLVRDIRGLQYVRIG